MAINPYDYLNEHERLEWAINANVPCPPEQPQACLQVDRQDSLLVLKDVIGNMTMIQAFMTNIVNGMPERAGRYLVWIRNGNVILKLERGDWPNTLTVNEERIESPWFTFAVVWNHFIPVSTSEE